LLARSFVPTVTAPSLSAGSALRRNVSLDLGVALSIGLTTAVAGGLVPTIARQNGLAPIGLALMAAAPFLGNLLSAFAGRYGPQGVRGYGLLRVGGALLLVPVALAPNALLIVAGICAFQLCVSFGSPFQTRIWGAMYPGEVRGRVIGILGTARAATAAAGAMAIGALADQAGVPFAVTLAGFVGAAFALGALGLRSGRPLPTRTFSAHEAVATLTASPRLRRLVLAQGLYGAGTIAAFPLYALVNVDRLHLSLGDVGTIAVVGAAATMVSYTAWGTAGDRLGYAVGLRGGAAFGVLSVALVAVAPNMAVMLLASIAGGLSNAGIDIGIQGAMASHTSLADRAAAMAGWNSLTGVRGMIAAIVASAAIQVGLVDVTTALALCVIPATLGLLVYLDLPMPAAVARLRRNHARDAIAGPDGLETLNPETLAA
jgi:MFS family permease